MECDGIGWNWFQSEQVNSRGFHLPEYVWCEALKRKGLSHINSFGKAVNKKRWVSSQCSQNAHVFIDNLIWSWISWVWRAAWWRWWVDASWCNSGSNLIRLRGISWSSVWLSWWVRIGSWIRLWWHSWLLSIAVVSLSWEWWCLLDVSWSHSSSDSDSHWWWWWSISDASSNSSGDWEWWWWGVVSESHWGCTKSNRSTVRSVTWRTWGRGRRTARATVHLKNATILGVLKAEKKIDE